MTFYATLEVADVAATTRYILVDKSSGSYGHTADTDLRLLSLRVGLDKEGTGDWVVRVGVVQEVDASNGSVKFFYVAQRRGTSNLNQIVQFRNGPGLLGSLNPDSVISSNDVSGSTNWQNDVTLANPTGSDTAPGAGDIVVELVEVSGTATLSATITAEYEHAA